jgi:hypothetical protein
MRKLLLATTVIAAATIASEASYATTVYTLSDWQIANNIDVDVTSPYIPGSSVDALSGQLVNYAGSPQFDVFCTDITHDLQGFGGSTPNNLWTPVSFGTTPITNPNDPLASTQRAEQIGWLVNNYAAHSASPPAPFAGGHGIYSAAQEFSSATQIAIWTVEYATTPNDGGIGDPTLDFTSSDPALNGSLGLVDDLVNDAIADYSAVAIIPTELAPWDATANGGQGGINWSLNQAQSFLTASQLNNGQCVTNCPEPWSMALLGSGLLALGWVRRNRRA